MTGRATEALQRLREIRDELGAEDAPLRVNLRDYAAPGSPAWDAFVEASGLPGHKVRLNTMVARVNQAIDALIAQLLGIEAPPPAAPPPEAPAPHEIERLAEVADDAPGEPRRIERQRLRRLTPDGIEYARAFLAGLREDPGGPIEPPRDLLYSDAYSAPFPGGIEVERRSFRTRREAAEYLAPILEPIGRLVVDQAGVWSWLGMFYFADTVPMADGEAQLTSQDESFVVGSEGYSLFLRWRHYLWSAYQIHEAYPDAVFLLDRDLHARGYLQDHILPNQQIFNSVGVVDLMLRLYTQGLAAKRGNRDGSGGLLHFLRVLNQLERTYDVYGMEPDALLRVLPSEFRAWDGGSGPRPGAAAAAARP